MAAAITNEEKERRNTRNESDDHLWRPPPLGAPAEPMKRLPPPAPVSAHLVAHFPESPIDGSGAGKSADSEQRP